MSGSDVGYRLCDADARKTLSGLLAHLTHDMSNLLTPLTAYPDIIAMDFDEAAPARELLNEIRRCSSEMVRIVTQLRYLSLNGDMLREKLDANDVLDAVLAVVTEDFEGKGIAIEKTRSSDTARLDGDVSLVTVAFEGLVRNGCEAAMRGGSRVSLSVAVKELPAGKRSDGVDSPAGRFVEFAVEDDGPGIDETVRDTLFEPFASTKPRAQVRGAGLGLTIAHRVACDHRGRLAVSREADGITRSTMSFPASG